MRKYRVYGIASASTIVGEYEAESEEKARDMAVNDQNADYNMGLCYHCARKVDIGDIYEYEAEEIE